MAFKAGSIYADTRVNTKGFKKGLQTLKKSTVIAGAAITAAFGATMVKAIKKANEFQKAITNVSTLVDAAEVSMVKMSKAVLTLNPELGDATELTKGMYQAFSSGAEDMDEALKVTEDSAIFAKAALTDTFTAVDVLTTAVNAYGKETMSTTKASDIFFQTIKSGKLTGEELASSIGTSIPLFSSAGVELEELASAMAAMTKQGVDANSATTQLNAIINAFLKPSSSMVDLLKEMGYESGSAFIKAEGLAGALELVADATDGDAAAIAELVPNIRGMRGVMALTGEGGKTFTATLEEMGNAAGITTEAFEKQEKTFDTFKNAAGQVLTVLGNIGSVFVKKIAAGATEAATSMRDFLMSDKAMYLFANIAGFVAGAFTAIKEAVKVLVDTFKQTLGPTIQIIRESFSELFELMGMDGTEGTMILAGAMRGLGIALSIPINLLSNFINLIITLVKSSRLGIKNIKNFIDVLKGEKTWKDAGEEQKQFSEDAKEIWRDFGKDTKDMWAGTWDQIKNFGENVKNDSEEISTNIKFSYENASDFITTNWDEMVSGVTGGQDSILTNAQGNNDDLEEDEAETAESITAKYEEELERRLSRQNEIAVRRQAAHEEEMRLWTEALEAHYDELATMEEEKNAEEEETWKEQWERKLEQVRGYTDLIRNTVAFGFDAMRSISDQYYANEEATMELAHQKELKKLDTKLKNEVITQEEYDEEKEELDNKHNKEKNKLAKKQFKTQKAFDIAQVWLSAASSIMGWWSQAPILGPIAGPVFATIMTGAVMAAAAVQSSLIDKQKFVPAMEKGGRTSGGNVMMNETGGEITRLPGGSLIIPNDISQQIAASTGSGFGEIELNFYDTTFKDKNDIDYLVEQVSTRLGRELRLRG